MKTIRCFITSILLCSLAACSSDDSTTISEKLIAPEYNLPKGEPGTIDELIYNIHEKYGTYILYNFQEQDFKKKWNGKWLAWYAPANTKENLKYVEKFVKILHESVLTKYDEEFVRRNFPYKVFLVDTLCENTLSYNKRLVRKVLSNGNNAIAISNVGKASDSWTNNDWKQLSVELDKAFTVFYYSSFTEKPVKFISLRFPKMFFPTVADPQREYSKYLYSCYSVGYAEGKLNAYLSPNEDQDFASFIRLISGTKGTELKHIFKRFKIMKERAVALYTFMKIKMNMDLIATQNTNFPEDKLSIDIFNK